MAKPDTSKTGTPVEYELNTDSVSSSKGRATPTRKEREAANLRPLVSSDRKAGNKANRAKMAESREKARIGMANGEEKYLPMKDRGVQRRYIRDHFDARWSVGELIIPVMFIIIILNFIKDVSIQSAAFIGLLGFFAIAVIDSVVAGIIVKRKLADKFGSDKLQSGNAWYGAMRAFQFRRLRLPKPQVKRGQYPA